MVHNIGMGELVAKELAYRIVDHILLVLKTAIKAGEMHFQYSKLKNLFTD